MTVGIPLLQEGEDVKVVPYVLPIEAPPEVLGMTVAEWLGVDDSPS